MPGMDPFSPAARLHNLQQEDNNNLLAAAEKARLMMLYRAGGGLGPPSLPPPPLPPSLPLSPELLARYSAIQANLQGLYNPALLAAMVRTSTPSSTTASLPFLPSLPSLPLSPKSPSDPVKSQRFSPYVLPASSRPAESPTRFSTQSDGEGRSPSPRSSPGPGLQPTPPRPGHQQQLHR